MKKRTYLLTAFAIVIVCGTATALWPDGDLSSDEPPFNLIAMPLREVQGGIWMDGGSVWVGVVDSKGASFDLVFPYDHSTGGYPKAFHGSPKLSGPDSKVLTDPARAREIALNWLQGTGHADGWFSWVANNSPIAPDRLPRSRRDEGVNEAFDYLSGRNRSLIGRVQRDGLGEVFK